MSARKEQIEQCQNAWQYLDGSYRGYNGAISDNETRAKRGEKQTFCVVCRRWKWEDQRCELFDTV